MTACTITVRVSPGARVDEIGGWLGDELRVRLRAAPQRGEANVALLRMLARQLGVRLSDIELVSGAASRRKRLRVEGLEESEVRARLPSG